MIAFTLFSAVAVFYVRNIIAVNDLTKKINELIGEREKLIIENKELIAEEKKLLVKERIIPIAQEKLGMIFPEDPTIVLKLSEKNLRIHPFGKSLINNK